MVNETEDYRWKRDSRWTEVVEWSQENFILGVSQTKKGSWMEFQSLEKKFKIQNFHWESFSPSFLETFFLSLKTCLAGLGVIWISLTNVAKALKTKSGKEFRNFLNLVRAGLLSILVELVLRRYNKNDIWK